MKDRARNSNVDASSTRRVTTQRQRLVCRFARTKPLPPCCAIHLPSLTAFTHWMQLQGGEFHINPLPPLMGMQCLPSLASLAHYLLVTRSARSPARTSLTIHNIYNNNIISKQIGVCYCLHSPTHHSTQRPRINYIYPVHPTHHTFFHNYEIRRPN